MIEGRALSSFMNLVFEGMTGFKYLNIDKVPTVAICNDPDFLFGCLPLGLRRHERSRLATR